MQEKDWRSMEEVLQAFIHDLELIVQQSRETKSSIDRELAQIREELRHERRDLHQIIQLLQRILGDVEPKLTSVAISFSKPATKGATMPASGFTEGPVTLTVAGQTVEAVVDGYNQFGSPMPSDGSFTMPAATWAIDNSDVATSTPTDSGSTVVTAVSNGVANLSVTVTASEGVNVSDTEAVTVAIPIVPPPASVLSSIKIAFSTPVVGTGRRR